MKKTQRQFYLKTMVEVHIPKWHDAHKCTDPILADKTSNFKNGARDLMLPGLAQWTNKYTIRMHIVGKTLNEEKWISWDNGKDKICVFKTQLEICRMHKQHASMHVSCIVTCSLSYIP